MTSNARIPIRLACVPEQVNLPLTETAPQHGLWAKHGLDVQLSLVPEGTGRMLDLVESAQVDVALTVCDAFLVAAGKGRPLRLRGVWVVSPLTWSVVAAPEQRGRSVEAMLQEKRANNEPLKIGVSRVGSGSHTMAFSLAQQLSVEIASEYVQFVVCDHFEGLRHAIRAREIDLFLWEKFTTKPCIDSGELYEVGACVIPWPAFVAVTRARSLSQSECSEERERALHKLFIAMHEAAQLFVGNRAAAVDLIQSEYHHTKDDAEAWLSACRYNDDPSLSADDEVLQRSLRALAAMGLVPPSLSPRDVKG